VKIRRSYGQLQYDTIRDNKGLITCAQKLINSQINLAHGTRNEKNKES